MKKLANFIVDKRIFITIFFGLFMIYAAFGINRVNVEDDMTQFLPETSDARQALEILENDFTVLGMTRIMIRGVTLEEATSLRQQFMALDGVAGTLSPVEDVSLFREINGVGHALFDIMFLPGEENEEAAVNAFNTIIYILEASDFDFFVPVSFVDTSMDDLLRSLNIALVIAIFVVLAILTLTTKRFVMPFLYLTALGISIVFNMGTNHWLGTISVISLAVAPILQLALAVDFSNIIANRFEDELEKNSNKEEAMKAALTKSIPEILTSTPTKIFGLLSLSIMTLGIGQDLGFVLAKGILFSALTVVFLLPALILFSSKILDKTKHRSLMVNVKPVGNFSIRHRFKIIPMFLMTVIFFGVFTGLAGFYFMESSVQTSRPTDTQIAIEETENVFGFTNQIVMIMPDHDWETHRLFINFVHMISEELLENTDYEITNIMGWANFTIPGTDVMLLSHLNSASQLADVVNSLLVLAGDDLDIDPMIIQVVADIIWDFWENELNSPIANPTIFDFIYYTVLQEDFFEEFIGFLLDIMVDLIPAINLILDMLPEGLLPEDFDINEILEMLEDINKEDIMYLIEPIQEIIQQEVGAGLLFGKSQLVGETRALVIIETNLPIEGEVTFDFLEVLMYDVKEIDERIVFTGESVVAFEFMTTFTMDYIGVVLISFFSVLVVITILFKSIIKALTLALTIYGSLFITFGIFSLLNISLFFVGVLIVVGIKIGATILYAVLLANRYEEFKKEQEPKEAIASALNSSFPNIIASGSILAIASLLLFLLATDPVVASFTLVLTTGVIIAMAIVLFILPAILYTFDKKNKHLEKQ